MRSYTQPLSENPGRHINAIVHNIVHDTVNCLIDIDLPPKRDQVLFRRFICKCYTKRYAGGLPELATPSYPNHARATLHKHWSLACDSNVPRGWVSRRTCCNC